MSREKLLEILEKLPLALVKTKSERGLLCEVWVDHIGIRYRKSECQDSTGEENSPDIAEGAVLSWTEMEDEALEKWFDMLYESDNPHLAKWQDEYDTHYEYYNDEETELKICCYSENGMGSIVCAMIGVVKSIDDFGRDSIKELLSDSFWENSGEFEDGLNAVDELCCDEEKYLSWEEAVVAVFGHFHLSYESNLGSGEDYPGIDADKLMQYLLGCC